MSRNSRSKAVEARPAGRGSFERPPEETTFYPAQVRVAIRSITEFSTGTAADLIRSFNGEAELGIVFLMIARATGSISRFERGRADFGSRQPISINALSKMLDRPLETTRQQVHRLVATGWCERMADGVVIAGTGLRQVALHALFTVLHDRFLTEIAGLRAFDFPVPVAGDGEGWQSIILEVAIELLLKAIELGGIIHGGWIKVILATALMTANARPITTDSMLSQAYSESLTPPPDTVRQPITIAQLARGVSLPYPTVRRHVLGQIAAGQMVPTEGGVLLSLDWMQTPAVLASGARLTTSLNEALRRLARSGFPFGEEERAYLVGPVERVSFA